jgi:gamma-glutamyltranspeptidase/glutathione hydrolase
MVVGSPGGTTIPTSVFQTIVDVVDFKMTAADAVNKPKFHNEWMPDVISMESNFPAETIKELKAMGYTISESSLGRVELIRVREDGNLDIVADNRASSDCAEGY